MKKRRSKKVVHRPTAKKRGRSRSMLMDSPALRPSGWRKSAQSDLQLTLKVPQVKVGPRHRKEMGNITALAKDINERGLLHPIVVDHKNNLIAGERRLKAWQISNFRDQSLWLDLDSAMLHACRTLIVAHIDGWEQSSGIAHEVEFFVRRGRPIFDLDPKTLRMVKREMSTKFEHLGT